LDLVPIFLLITTIICDALKLTAMMSIN